MNVCKIPTAREDVDSRWISQHKRHVTESKEAEPEVLLIGDSIIQRLELYPIWNDLIAPLHALNLGIGGDTTQNTLWRIKNGALDSLRPKAVVVMVGTNNVKNSAEDVADGIIEIIQELKNKFPNSVLIFWGLLPRGELADNVPSKKNEDVNNIVREYIESIPNAEFVSVVDSLKSETGVISRQDLFDFLHPTDVGYRKTFKPVYEILIKVLHNNYP